MKETRVTTSVNAGVAHVCLTRPKQHNGIDFDMLHAVIREAKALRKRRDLRAVILHGEGESFCAGLDFKTVMSQPLRAAWHYSKLWQFWQNDFQRWSLAWRRVPVPVIAAIHGNCFGGGLQLALGADIRIATPDARLSFLEAKWGLVPDMGGVALVRELVPIDVAKELVFSGRIVRGDEALEMGLVTHVADDPLAAAQALAAEFMGRSPDSVAAGKFLLQRAWGASERGALGQERAWQRRLMGTANQRIAVRNAMGSRSAEIKAFKPRSGRLG